MHFVPSRDGLNVPSFGAKYFFTPPLLSSIPWFSHFFQGAAAAVAGRGSPPPLGRRGELVGRYVPMCALAAKYNEKRNS